MILYARNFVPSWAGAIAIDLLPAVLVFIVAVTQSAIRQGREGSGIEDTMTLAELRAAVTALRDVEGTMGEARRPPESHEAPPDWHHEDTAPEPEDPDPAEDRPEKGPERGTA